MRIGVFKEKDSENRVSIVPNSVRKLVKAGYDVVIESGAGVKSNYHDSEYKSAGANVEDRGTVRNAEILVSIGFPNPDDISEKGLSFALVTHSGTPIEFTSAITRMLRCLALT